eukprot:8130220-Alexandrium_andersonii.AAC.1
MFGCARGGAVAEGQDAHGDARQPTVAANKETAVERLTAACMQCRLARARTISCQANARLVHINRHGQTNAP